MGQANAVDLPDPLEPGASDAAGRANADDLLAQLAGEEVDRLLAEAEIDDGVRAAKAGASDLESQIAAPTNFEPDLALEAELRKAAENEIDDELSPKTAAEPASHAQAVADELEADEAIHRRIATIADFSQIAQAEDDSEETSKPLPIYLRWLEWINFPVAMLPNSVQDLMGKIAILTLLNAVAVLIYVLIFRKHG